MDSPETSSETSPETSSSPQTSSSSHTTHSVTTINLLLKSTSEIDIPSINLLNQLKNQKQPENAKQTFEYFYQKKIKCAVTNNCIGFCYRYGIGCEKDEKLAFIYFEKASKKGLAMGQLNLGRCFLKGIGCEKNEEEAIELFRLSAHQLCPPAFSSLGYCYKNSLCGLKKNLWLAERFTKRATDHGLVV